MNSRRDTLADRVARAQREIENWNPRLLAAMQLQGGAATQSTEQSPGIRPTPEACERSKTRGDLSLQVVSLITPR